MFQLRTVFLTALASLAVLAAACSDSDAPPATDEATNPVVTARVDVVRRRIEANNAKDWNTWESLHTTNAVRTAPELPEPVQGAKAMRAGIEELVQTFPDYHLELVEAFGSGDRVVAKIHTTATMSGPMAVGGTVLPATNRRFESDWIAVLRFEGDRIAAIEEFFDNYAILVQLGLAPSL